jgi:polyphosphate kinase
VPTVPGDQSNLIQRNNSERRSESTAAESNIPEPRADERASSGTDVDTKSIAPHTSDEADAQKVSNDKQQTEIQAAGIEYDLDSAELYLNRELTWLSFNARVLHEAGDERNPLLERVKFLAFSDNNLDEFVMKRIGGLKQQLAAGVHQTTVDGRTPAQQMIECNAQIRALRAKQEEIYTTLLAELEKHEIRFLQYEELTAEQRLRIRDSFVKNIFPIVTPLAMDPAHPFPFISNLTINLLLTMRYPGEDELQMARVKVPSIKGLTSRLLPVDEPGSGHLFVSLDEVMANNLDLLFPGMEIASCEIFRVTRNINVVRNEETATDLLQMIESELRERPFAPIVRLEIESGMDATHRGMLTAELGLDPDLDVFESQGMLGMRDLFEIAALDIPELHDTALHPADHPVLAQDARNIFYIIRENGPLLLQHPYQSFGTSVERFLRTASEDPKVLAIKMTLYRTSAEAEIVDLLINAARNGKQVAVLVELKASFDEAANIDRARSLEEAGVHVTYGVLGLKTHSKTILVVRQDFDTLRRYCHIGTGNYHPGTARLYSDLGLLTCDEDIGHDLTQLFNYLTGYSPPPSYRKILTAPYALKKPLLKKIEREISLHSPDSPGHIQLKTNALEDPDVTRALYKACQAGVKVDLIVRDSCRFRPHVPGLSETATVISIVGRFLEHSRIYYFRNGGDEEYFIGSADLMQRNLSARVEVITPVEDPELRQELRLILAAQLSDFRSAWDMQADGTYIQRQPTDGDKGQRGCQEQLIAAANKRQSAASKHKEKKIRSKLLNRFQKKLEESGK